MKGIITEKDIARVKKNLEEARQQKDIKRICFLEATLNIYEKKTQF